MLGQRPPGEDEPLPSWGCTLVVLGSFVGGVAGFYVGYYLAQWASSYNTVGLLLFFGPLCGAVLGALFYPLAAWAIRNWRRGRET
jgi:hypothetical protein